MPTRNRRKFISQSIKYFQKQDYPNKELIILDNGDDKVKDLIPISNDIHYFSIDSKVKLGEVRNIGVSHSKGDIVIMWDDDDWFHPSRITKQIQPILNNTADLTGIEYRFAYDLNGDQCWKVSKNTDEEIFQYGIIAFRKEIWEKFVKYPPVSVGEDVRFQKECLEKGFKFSIIPNDGLFIHVGHYTNTWPILFGKEMVKFSSEKIDTPDFFLEDNLFYKNLRELRESELQLKLRIKEMSEKHMDVTLEIMNERSKILSRIQKLIDERSMKISRIEKIEEINQKLRDERSMMISRIEKIEEINQKLRKENQELLKTRHELREDKEMKKES